MAADGYKKVKKIRVIEEGLFEGLSNPASKSAMFSTKHAQVSVKFG